MFDKLISFNKFIVLHIPKTAGTTIRKQLILYKPDKVKAYDVHNHSTYKQFKEYTIDKKIDIDKFDYIVSVRNPIGRFLSAYNFLKDIDERIIKNKQFNNRDEKFHKDRLKFLKELSIDGFVNLLTSKDKKNEVEKKWFYEKQDYQYKLNFLPQITWIDGIKENKLNIFKVEDKKIYSFLDIEDIFLKRKIYDRHTNENNKTKIYDYFIEDFKRFNYTIKDYIV